MTGSLTIDDFPDFFGAVHCHLGHTNPDGSPLSPFTWQTRLAGEVWSDGRWPDVDIPTGAGKTSVVLIATFLLALDAGRPVEERTMPRRIAMVVDRRVVVDQAYVEAKALLRALVDPTDPVLTTVADRLRSLWGGKEGAPPMRVEMLRGGIVRDESWARRPDRPAILASTVDQVGSRLLFRGYGLSPSMRPIHAGLLGNDALIFLDEVHLSRPFAQTLRQLRETYRTWGGYQEEDGSRARDRWQVAELSATPRDERSRDGEPERRFHLDPGRDDLSPDGAPVLYRRLHASKVAETRLVKVSKTDRAKADRTFAKECAKEALRLLDRERIDTIAVVVNRVSTARRVYDEIREGHREGVEVVLMTGRMREADRMVLQERLQTRLKTGRARMLDATASLVVVATQCIEAGADFDFDGLVTECASLDALRQRMGRLDRDGYLWDAGVSAPSVVLARSADVGSDEDPVYGPALRMTWNWLEEASRREQLDFGWAAWQHLEPERAVVSELAAPSSTAPVLLPTHLDLLVQTAPTPTTDPDVSLWLHGMGRPSTDIQIVWRDDLTFELLAAACDGSAGRDDEDPLSGSTSSDGGDDAGASIDRTTALRCVMDLLAFRPPASSETLSVPIAAALAWLRAPAEGGRDVDDDLSDVDGSRTTGTGAAGPPAMRPVAIWRGGETTVERVSGQLSPGATIVVPSSYGGIRRGEFDGRTYGWWDPTSWAPVRDVGDRAQRRQRGIAVLRLRPDLQAAVPGDWVPSPGSLTDEDDYRGPVLEWIAGIDVTSVHDDDVSAAVRDMQDAIRAVRADDRLEDVDDRLELVELQSPPWSATGLTSWFGVSYRLPRSAEDESDRRSTLDVEPEPLDLEPENSSFVASKRLVVLDEHLHGVEKWARRLATHCGLPAWLVDDVALAGRLHDLGKADPRFQAMLRGGAPRLDGEPLLAKSRIAATDRTAKRKAQQQSGYPQGARHELLSLALIAQEPSIIEKATDWDLVCHLVTSHHGYCRPFAPYVPDGHPEMVEAKSDPWTLVASSDHRLTRIDSGVADRFWMLVRQYGWFRLAWFEAILRLADHRRSEDEQEHVGRSQRRQAR
ncbi:MAG TPA: type I-U CRISPR-associated helicase/endonuclease Cas3 [Acidimicrobiales bacterium]|nr:type I-U CRISPR-associated helicase/endonuclease Cas3 [Acidimicrobiales bacterium]